MNIKSMLLRLQTALNLDGLVEELILNNGPFKPGAALTNANWQNDPATEKSLLESAAMDAGNRNPGDGSPSIINLVVGYNSSPSSHAALDLTLWIAHQTRLATRQQVVVQVVYVLEDATWSHLNYDFHLNSPDSPGQAVSYAHHHPAQAPDFTESRRVESARFAPANCALLPANGESVELLSYADQVLWQARCLANEWRGSLETHLRFGNVASELQAVVEAEAARLLILGCKSREHPLLQQLGQPFPCPILGIPARSVE